MINFRDGQVIEWRNLVKYQDLIPSMNRRTFDLLEAMNDLVPIIYERSRLDTFLTWVRNCQELGLIDSVDKQGIQQEMIHGCGGM